MRAIVLTIMFTCVVFCTNGMTSAHVKSSIGLISHTMFIPQYFGFAAVFSYLPRTTPIYLSFPLGLVPVFFICLVEARLFLGLANFIGTLPHIEWVGRKKTKTNDNF